MTKIRISTDRTNQNLMKEILKRNCDVYGKNMSIRITDDFGHYSNGHYFGKMRIPIRGIGSYEKVGKSTFFGGVDIVKWTGKEKEVEDWECNRCHREE